MKTLAALLLLSACQAPKPAQTFDKRVLVVFRDETPKSFTASLAGLIQPFTKLILP